MTVVLDLRPAPTVPSSPRREIHTYCTFGTDPQPGDRALCGYVKRTPSGVVSTGPTCAVCADLREAWLGGWRP